MREKEEGRERDDMMADENGSEHARTRREINISTKSNGMQVEIRHARRSDAGLNKKRMFSVH